MGGNIFNKKYNFKADRISISEKADILSEITPIIKKHINVNTVIEPSVIGEKRDFGDIDLLLNVDDSYMFDIDLHVLYNDIAVRDKNDEPIIVHNGTVKAFAYEYNDKIIEIDLIFIKKSKWDIATTFYSNDPFGNLLGKMTRLFNIKFGYNGLYYIHKHENGKIENLHITDDSNMLFKYIGLDKNIFNKGFDTYVELYEYISKSSLFFTELFSPENRRHIDRKRNDKRSSFKEFEKWISDNKHNLKNEFPSYSYREKESYVNDFFPPHTLSTRINDSCNTISNNLAIKKKLNVRLFLSKLELNPVKHGKIISEIINEYRKTKTIKYLLETDSDVLFNDVLTLINKK